jgi:GNAT superfamily N-acetyltransferase
MNRQTIEIHPLSAERLADFLAFFDRDAFTDNPAWSSCFCQYLYVDHRSVDWESRTGPQNRAAACERVCSRTMQGYLAYRDDKPVGWCNAAPRALMDAFNGESDPDAGRIGEIGCFVIAKAHRRSGVATALLAAACEGLRAQGLDIAEARPAPDAQSDAQHYHGPLAMYLAAGFTIHRKGGDGRVIVRKPLRGGAIGEPREAAGRTTG